MKLRSIIFSIAVLMAAAAVSAQAPATSWPQFRGSAPLVGTTQATLPAQLEVQWTYEAGDAVDSSAAIVDGVVYVGSADGHLHAVNLADGKPKWKYQASPDGIGESSPAVAISPLIGGRALKGPADRMMHSLGHESSALGVARLYEGLIDGFVIDHLDAEQAAEIEDLGMSVLSTDAIMHDVPDRGRLAREVISFGRSLRIKATA